MNLYPWGMLLLGFFIGGAVVKLCSRRREKKLRAELTALVNAVVAETELDRTRGMQLAIMRAWQVLRPRGMW